MLIALNLLSTVWLIVTWRVSGFKAALNLFLYAVLIAFSAVVSFQTGVITG